MAVIAPAAIWGAHTALGAAITVGAAGAGLAGGLMLANKSKKDKPEAPKPPQLPPAPDPAKAEEQAANAARKRQLALKSSGKTMYTSPLGSQGQADVARKTLLGN